MMKTIFAVLLLVGVCAAESSQTDNEDCECVPYYQCNILGLMNDDGEGIIDIRNGLVGANNPELGRKSCNHYLSVCCRQDELVSGHDVDPPTGGHVDKEPPNGGHGNHDSTEAPTGGHGDEYPTESSTDCYESKYPTEPPTGGHGHEHPTEPPTGGHGHEYPTEPPTGGHGHEHPTEPPTGGHGHEHPTVKPHASKGCGYRNANGVGFRITGNFNNEANFAEFPWMVAILSKYKVDEDIFVKTYQCGGSLVHPKVILTGAHCVYGKLASELFIRAGEWDSQTVSEALPHQDRDVAVVITHPKFNKKNLHNDFALLILNEPVQLADNVQPICLPEKHEYFDNSNCFATGWGKNKFGEQGKYQVILKAVELPTVQHDKCQFSLRQTRLGKYFKLDQSFMCAGGVGGVDTCTGDGGSPLVCPLANDSTRYAQAGIVAWGIGCGKDGVPGVYGDVARARQWIDEQLSSYNIDSHFYTPGPSNNKPPAHGAGFSDYPSS